MEAILTFRRNSLQMSISGNPCTSNLKKRRFSNIGLPTEDDAAPAAARTWKDDFRQTLKALLDPTLLGSPSFIILAISGFMTMICFYVPFNYLNVMMERVSFLRNSINIGLLQIPNLSDGQKSLPIALLGIFNIIARIACG